MSENSALNEMLPMLLGEFDNKEQFSELKDGVIKNFPYARHINTCINEKILGLPENFDGIFMVEESYYTVNDRTNAMPHLFLFTQIDVDKVQLDSFDIPKEYDKKTFTAENITTIKFEDLEKSAKFTPAVYSKKGNVYEGGSVSMFSPVLKFTLFEKFSDECLEVTEMMEVNGKRTFGYDVPIKYVRI